MQLPILLTLFFGAQAGFFEGSNFEEFKHHIAKANDGIFEANGEIRSDVFDTWSDSELHKWLAYHNLDSSGGTSTEALIAKAKVHKDKLVADLKELIDSPPPSEKILTKGAEYFEQGKKSVYDAWSDSALSNYLAARGEEVQAALSHENLVELAEKSKKTVVDTSNEVSRAWFDSWTYAELKSSLDSLGKSAEGTRQKLADSLWEEYKKLKVSAAEGKVQGQKEAEKTLKSLEKWRKDTFDQWSTEDLKEYVAQFGPSPPTKREKLVAFARQNWSYFIYGEHQPQTWTDTISHYGHLASVHLAAGLDFFKQKLFTKDDL